MNGSQQLVAIGGLTLVGLNFWDRDRKTFAAGALSGGWLKGASLNTDPNKSSEAAHTIVKSTALELLFVAVATVIAGASPSAGSAMAAVIGALVILWAVHHFNGKASQ